MFATVLDANIGATLSKMIEAAFGSCAAKKAASYADASHRTLEKAIQGRTELGAWKLLRMSRHPGFRAELRAYLDHIEMEEGKIALRVDEIAAQRLRHPDSDAGASRTPLRAAALRTTVQAMGVPRRGVSK